MNKTYVGISRDHSGSMSLLKKYAMDDYNSNISTLKHESLTNNQDTIISVVACGVGHPARNVRELVNSSLKSVGALSFYDTTGSSTPLFDSVVDLVNIMKATPDANDKSVAFLIMVVTDGYDNSSRISGKELGALIRELQATDRWTFVFRIPPGHKKNLIQLGIPEANILEWELTRQGLETATQITTASISTYYSGRAKGQTATRSFFVEPDLSKIDTKVLAVNMTDISNEIRTYLVPHTYHGMKIKEFIESHLSTFVSGCAFYQLTKSEKEVQEYKKILVRDKTTSKTYAGDAAKSLLGLPLVGNFKLNPTDHSKFEIFVQSTSVNRKLMGGTTVVYWPNVR